MNKITILFLSIAWLLTACDSGDIREQQGEKESRGIIVRMSGRISGTQSWSSRYQIVLAAFSNIDDYSILQKELPTGIQNGDSIDLVLADIGGTANQVQLCVVDKVRERVAAFRQLKLTDEMFKHPKDTVRFDIGSTDVSMYSVVERDLFDNICSKCHGNNGRAAGDMDLRKGYAYTSTVNVSSHIDPTQKRIVPGNAKNSWIVRVLTPGNENLTHYKDHTLILDNDRDNKYFSLLKDWINNGAQR